jgi:glycosyltransferase involved in cell wall biosynthesis
VIVHQLLCAAGPVDAVTNQGFAWRRQFDAWGWGGSDFAEVVAPGMDKQQMRPLKAFKPAADTPVLVHYSGYAPALERLVAPPSRFLVLSHNITPARFFWEIEPFEGVRCSLGPPQLARIAQRADIAAGVSAFNASELPVPDADVIPILFDRSKLPAPGPPPEGPPTVLFVGRLAPHKRQDLVIRAFGLYRKLHAPDARLVLIGVPITPDYEARLRQLAEEVAPGAVTFRNGIPAAELHDHYRSAHAFLCLSEHEGFCIPLLEAFHFGVPVIARPAGGIGEVVGDAGILLGPDDELPEVAELLHLAVSDQSLRDTLRPRAEARLDHYAADRVAAHMRTCLEELAA